MFPIWVFVPLGVGLAVLIRVLLDRLDRARLRDHFALCGEEVVDIQWDPFGPGWFGEKSDRIYLVSLRDRDGDVRSVHCKTSMWSGVYETERRDPLRDPRGRKAERALRAENERLRDEVERLRRGDTRP